MNREKAKRLAANLAVFFVSFLGAFAAAEVVVRMLFKDDVFLFPPYHTDVQYGEFTLRRIVPNSVFWHTSVDGSWRFETNAQGFRNREDFEYEKREGVVRVLVMGDSHTQGHEVRQDFTYSSAIEKYLNARGLETQVLNTGVSGFSTAEALILLENEGIKYDPDFVVLGFYANDFEDNVKAGLFRLNEDGSLSVAKKQHLPGVRAQNLINGLPMIGWLSENSYFYSLLFNNTWEFFKKRLASDAAATAAQYAVPTKDDNSTYELELAAALLARMHRFCSERGIPLIVLDVPRINGRSSLQSLAERMPQLSDVHIDGSALLAKYSNVADVHLPNGNRHISEFSHLVLGVAVAENIAARLGAREQLGQLDSTE
jgi:hypothetical protein